VTGAELGNVLQRIYATPKEIVARGEGSGELAAASPARADHDLRTAIDEKGNLVCRQVGKL